MRSLTLLVILFVSSRSAVASENWPAFRGDNGIGVNTEAQIPAEFSDSEHVAWKVSVPGWGHSSPVVWDGQIWMTTATEDGLTMSVVCVDAATGKLLHDITLFKNESVSDTHHEVNSFASCTPVIEAGRVYCHFGHYGTACVETATGKILWSRRDIKVDEYRGPASSPILLDDLLIVLCDGIDEQFVLALNKLTGKTVWRTDRTIDYGTDNGDMKKGFGTPSVFQVGNHLELVAPTAVETLAYNPETGKEIWRVRHGGMNASARPLLGKGLVFITAGNDDTSLIAVKPGTGDLTQEGIVWKSGKAVAHKSSPLIVNDLLFMISDSGVATCRDIASGEIYWMKRLGGDYWASPVSDGTNIFCFGTDGQIPVFAAERRFRLASENSLPESIYSTPAVTHDAMFVRTRHHLYRIE